MSLATILVICQLDTLRQTPPETNISISFLRILFRTQNYSYWDHIDEKQNLHIIFNTKH